eukprot:545811_1
MEKTLLQLFDSVQQFYKQSLRNKAIIYGASLLSVLSLRYLYCKIHRKIKSLPPGPAGIPIFGSLFAFRLNQRNFLSMEILAENDSSASPQTLLRILINQTKFPEIICMLIMQYAKLQLNIEFPDIISIKRDRNAVIDKIYTNIDTSLLQSILQSHKGFRITIECVLQSDRIITIPSMSQKGDAYVFIEISGTILKIYMRGITRQTLVGPKGGSIDDVYHWNTQIKFRISPEIEEKFRNEIVCIDILFEWIDHQNEYDSGYKISVESHELKLNRMNHYEIAKVKHLSLRSLENVNILYGKKKKYYRNRRKCIFSISSLND